MTTKNIRAVTYLPPQYHKQLRQYMKQQNLTESAAIVEIVKQFFDEPTEPDTSLKTWVEDIVTERLAETQTGVETLKAQMAQMQQLLTGVMSGRTPRKSHRQSFSKPQLMPLKASDLARRLGVNTDTVEKEASKGNDHFHSWSRNKDMSSVAWEQRGDLYHPLN